MLDCSLDRRQLGLRFPLGLASPRLFATRQPAGCCRPTLVTELGASVDPKGSEAAAVLRGPIAHALPRVADLAVVLDDLADRLDSLPSRVLDLSKLRAWPDGTGREELRNLKRLHPAWRGDRIGDEGDHFARERGNGDAGFRSYHPRLRGRPDRPPSARQAREPAVHRRCGPIPTHWPPPPGGLRRRPVGSPCAAGPERRLARARAP